jgi:hypothetical protein
MLELNNSGLTVKYSRILTQSFDILQHTYRQITSNFTGY